MTGGRSVFASAAVDSTVNRLLRSRERGPERNMQASPRCDRRLDARVAVELEEVVSRAQQLPFTFGCDPSSASKATCTARVFDLAKDRPDIGGVLAKVQVDGDAADRFLGGIGLTARAQDVGVNPRGCLL
jgi:hypothetical protein